MHRTRHTEDSCQRGIDTTGADCESRDRRMERIRIFCARNQGPSVVAVARSMVWPLLFWMSTCALWPGQAIADLQLETFHDPTEYCETETFEPECGHDQVVVVTEAQYGRMAVGRCVRTDYGYVGCKADVLPHLDRQCSGRKHCVVHIPDAELDNAKKCPLEFKTYLNVTYKCVQVETNACKYCSKSTHAKLVLPKANLASVVTFDSPDNCGSGRCPWLIEVQPGQKINITLYNFAPLRDAPGRGYQDMGFRYAVVKEKTAPKDTAIYCTKERESLAYTSVSNSVEIHVVSPEVFSRKGHFILHYEAVGCPDFDTPSEMWVKREDDQIRVGCQFSEDTWNRRCVGTQWEGDIGVCPKDPTTGKPPQGSLISLPLGVLIAIVVGIALVIGVLILTVGVVCLKRYRADRHPNVQTYGRIPLQQQHDYRQRPETTLYVRARQDPEYHQEMATHIHLVPKTPTVTGELTLTRKPPPPVIRHAATAAASLTGAAPTRENLYARRMETRPLPSLPNLAETSDDDSEKFNVQVHRTSSGREQNNPQNPRVVTRRAQSTGSSSRDDPQYFVLDPDELKGEDVAAQDRRAARVNNAQTQEADEVAAAATADGGEGQSQAKGPQKSPEEENAENLNKEVHLNNSCHEIPLRPTREGSQVTPETNNSGNCSWP